MKNKKIAAIIGCLIVQLCVGILYLWSIFRTDVSNAYGGWEGTAMVASYMVLRLSSATLSEESSMTIKVPNLRRYWAWFCFRQESGFPH